MRKMILFLIFVSGLAFAESIVLNIGEDFHLPVPSNHKIWMQTRKIVKLSQQGPTLILTGESEGYTAAMIGSRHFQIQVVLPNKKNLFAQFEKAGRKMLGLQMKIRQQQVDVQGKLVLWQDWLTLAQLSRDLDVPYTMSAKIPESLQNKVQNYWKEHFERAGLPPLPVHLAGTLRARTSTKGDLFEKYREILSPFGVSLEKDPAALNIAPVIKVEITVAEVKRNFDTTLGVDWKGPYAANIVPDINFQALESQGKGKILASPSLLCRSGKEAEFLAGGEFPMKIMTARTQDVVWKKYGVILKVRPQADLSGRMSIALEVEVSTLDGSKVVNGMQGLLTNRISSHFDLSKPQTIALSGLIKNEESKNSEGLPILSRMPILGALFSSKNFREHRTELVIFVRPSILKEENYSATAKNNDRRQHLGDLNHD